MTSENILENVKEMVKAFSEKINSPEVAKWIIEKPEEWMKPSLYPEFYGNAAKIILACREDIQKKVDKASGRSSARLSSLKWFAKEALASYNKSLHGLYKDEFDKWSLCSGHWIVRLSGDVECLPHLDIEHNMPIKSGTFFEQNKKVEQTEIEPLNMAALKEAVTANKKDPKPYIIEHNGERFGFNPKFLYNALNVLGSGTKCYVSNPKAPMFLVSENGEEEALILPINLESSRR